MNMVITLVSVTVELQLALAGFIWPSLGVCGGAVTEAGSPRCFHTCSETVQLSATVRVCVESIPMVLFRYLEKN